MKNSIKVMFTLCVLLIISCAPATQQSSESRIQGLEPQLEIVVQTGASQKIRSVAFSPDGRYALSAGGSQLKLWEVSSGREIRTFGKGMVVAFSPDGRYALSGGGSLGNHTINIWDISTGTEILEITLSNYLDYYLAPMYSINSVAFSPDGKSIFSAFGISPLAEKSIMQWEVSSGKLIKSFHEGRSNVKSMAISPDGKYILAGTVSSLGGDGSPTYFEHSLKLWEVSSGKLIRTFSGWNQEIDAVAFSPDGKYVLAGSSEIRLLEVSSGREIRTFETGVTHGVSSAAFSPDGKYILANILMDDGSILKLWDVSTGREIRTFDNVSGYRNSFAFSPDGKYILSGEGRKVKLRDVLSGSLIWASGADLVRFSDITPLSDGRYVLAGGHDNTVKVWDLQEGRLSRIFEEHADQVRVVGLSADGKYAISRSRDKTNKLWNISNGKLIRTFKGLLTFRSVRFSPDGKFVISESRDKTMKLWNISNGKLIRTFKGLTQEGMTVKISPDGRHALLVDGKTLILREISNDKEIWRVNKGKPVLSVAFSPDGKYIYSIVKISKEKSIMVYEVASGKLIKTFYEGIGYVESLAISPDGKYLLIAGYYSGMVALLDASSGKQTREFEHPFDGSSRNLYITFSPDGGTALSLSADQTGTLRLWDVSSGKEIYTDENYCGGAFAFSPDGKFLLSGCPDGRLRYIDIEKNELLVTMVGTTDGEWAVMTPDGMFDKSENFTGIHWVKGLDIIELDQFFDDFYTPGLLAQVLSGEELERPDINIAEILKQSPPPNVEIISPKVGEKFPNKTVEIQVRITDNGGGIDEVKLLHNGKRVSDDTRGMKKKATGKSVVRTYNVSLVSGRNEFIASAYSKGRIESRGYRLEVLFKGTAKTASSYILAIGINKYKNKQLNLNYARADATAFAELIKQKSKNLFKNVNVVTLYDREATKKSILSALDDIAAKASAEDVFTFYYAGHGTVVDNRFYFVTSENVKLYDREKLDLNAIYVKDLQEKLSNIKSLKQLIVMDACQSGAATELLAVRGASEEKALAQLARSAGVHVFASAGSEQFATEFKELGHGVFTYVFLEALRGKADGAPKDGKVTVNELKAYIDDQVPVLTEKYKGEAQYPTIASRGQDFPVGVVK